MADQNDELQKRLLATFQVEAGEHLKTMSSLLLELEKPLPDNQRTKAVERVFREAHSLKGAARAVHHVEIESICQILEDVFSKIKRGQLPFSPALGDLLYQAVVAIGGLIEPRGTEPTSPAATALLKQHLNQILAGQMQESSSSVAAPAVDSPHVQRPDVPVPAVSETVRIATAKLNKLMRQLEEVLPIRLASAQRNVELREAINALAKWKKARAGIVPVIRQMERQTARHGAYDGGSSPGPLSALLEYLGNEDPIIESFEDCLAGLRSAADHDHRSLVTVTDALLRDVREMHLMPFSSIVESFPRFTRELARDQQKEVVLRIEGSEIEIDRRILEEMKDPLLHLLRNCIDHGIESPEARIKKNKPKQGTIDIAITQLDSGKAEILITDDGAGIDPSKVMEAARRNGLIAADEAEQWDESRVFDLPFQSGLSTSPIITDVSGRGLGLAIVREKVEQLGGVVTLESSLGSGTRFRITLPLTLATFHGVLVRAGGRLFVVPAGNVERAIRFPFTDVLTVENKETISHDGKPVSLVLLADVLEMPRPPKPEESGGLAQAIVLASGPALIAFRVDEIVGEQEVLVKPLGRQLARVRNVAGASMLGNGRTVPILNVADLMKSAVLTASAMPAGVIPEDSQPATQRSILVVEDSITSRTLLKGILESAGFHVTTAVDGSDGYATLKTASFDLVVSDVEMPRMDGFDLTAKIRADKRLSELPVVLVTALESREHRERGIDVGANAYIVKSDFNQSNLLEVINRLI